MVYSGKIKITACVETGGLKAAFLKNKAKHKSHTWAFMKKTINVKMTHLQDALRKKDTTDTAFEKTPRPLQRSLIVDKLII